jgi:hypothetical protein
MRLTGEVRGAKVGILTRLPKLSFLPYPPGIVPEGFLAGSGFQLDIMQIWIL